MKIGIYGRVLNAREHREKAIELLKLLEKKNIACAIYGPFHNYLLTHQIIEDQYPEFTEQDFVSQEFDFLLSLGGDGTMLDTLSLVKDSGVPVLGINMGRLGFLASTRSDCIEAAIDELCYKSFTIDKRSLLKLESSEPIFGSFSYALNDFVLHKKDSSSMITVHTYLNGEFLNSYWADGLIISTPTGSSGYSLSCGGPVLFPRSSSFVITPIAPHNLNVRPVVIPDDNILSFEIEGRGNSFLASLDSRSAGFLSHIQMAVRKADFQFSMVRLSSEYYLTTLRDKLMWGKDVRN
jgi:NAD+ kinase